MALICRRELIVGSGAIFALASLPKLYARTFGRDLKVEALARPEARSVKPTWLPDESTLPVVKVGFGRVEIPPGQHGRGVIIEVPPGDHGGGAIVCSPGPNTFADDALCIVRCSNGIATFGGVGGQAINGKRLAWKLENVVIDRSLSGIEYPCVRPEAFSYFAMRKFKIRNVRDNGLIVPPMGTGVIDMEDGEIHHCGYGGAWHPVYCNQQDKIRFQNVHVHSAEASDENNGAHLLKLYANNVQVYGCSLEHAGAGEPTGGIGVGAYNSVFAPLDLGAYGQTTVVGNTIVRNSDYARSEIAGYRNRVWPEGIRRAIWSTTRSDQAPLAAFVCLQHSHQHLDQTKRICVMEHRRLAGKNRRGSVQLDHPLFQLVESGLHRVRIWQ